MMTYSRDHASDIMVLLPKEDVEKILRPPARWRGLLIGLVWAVVVLLCLALAATICWPKIAEACSITIPKQWKGDHPEQCSDTEYVVASCVLWAVVALCLAYPVHVTKKRALKSAGGKLVGLVLKAAFDQVSASSREPWRASETSGHASCGQGYVDLGWVLETHEQARRQGLTEADVNQRTRVLMAQRLSQDEPTMTTSSACDVMTGFLGFLLCSLCSPLTTIGPLRSAEYLLFAAIFVSLSNLDIIYWFFTKKE